MTGRQINDKEDSMETHHNPIDSWQWAGTSEQKVDRSKKGEEDA
jgi:hypothetical protein